MQGLQEKYQCALRKFPNFSVWILRISVSYLFLARTLPVNLLYRFDLLVKIDLLLLLFFYSFILISNYPTKQRFITRATWFLRLFVKFRSNFSLENNLQEYSWNFALDLKSVDRHICFLLKMNLFDQQDVRKSVSREKYHRIRLQPNDLHESLANLH